MLVVVHELLVILEFWNMTVWIHLLKKLSRDSPCMQLHQPLLAKQTLDKVNSGGLRITSLLSRLTSFACCAVHIYTLLPMCSNWKYMNWCLYCLNYTGALKPRPLVDKEKFILSYKSRLNAKDFSTGLGQIFSCPAKVFTDPATKNK